jgi:predicted dehydrogenase
MERANEFGDKYNIEKRYGSYEELANDPDVELIYIATPHSHHAEQAKMCLNAGKPVLVEKAFTTDAESAIEVMKLSEENNGGISRLSDPS